MQECIQGFKSLSLRQQEPESNALRRFGSVFFILTAVLVFVIKKCYNNDMEMKEHEEYIRRCYELAIAAGKKGYDTFGAIIVRDGVILQEAENTADHKNGLFGHAEFNLVHQCANKYSDEALREATFYTSCAPCVRCLAAIASLGVRNVVFGVSYEKFSLLTPNDYEPIDYEKVLSEIGIDIKMTGPILQDEGMRVFEWWGGEYHPLAELIEQMAEIKRKINHR